MTKLGVRALLADMYLWRGCMLGYYNANNSITYVHLRGINYDKHLHFRIG